MQVVIRQLQRLSPVQLAFFGSLLLSWVAIFGTVTIGKDGAFYIDIAQTFLDQDAAAAFQLFNWPWFSFLLGATHWLTGIPLESCAYLWCALFMAGTCALLVDCVQQRLPTAGYWAVLVVLAMPSFNTFRSDIIRELGFWFFSTLALWLALAWWTHGGWLRALAIQLAVIAAALFRLEAIMLSGALTFWLLPGLGCRAGWLRLLQLNALPLLCGILALGVLAGMSGASQGRVGHYLMLLDPRQIVGAFHELSSQFAGSLKAKYSRDDAGLIIFFGLLAAVLIKFIKLLGPFALPFLSGGSWRMVQTYRQQFAPFAWAWGGYLAVLLVFFIHEQFINSRYLSFLDLLVVPLAVLALVLFAERFPRMGKAVVVLALLVMLDNVISLGAKKTHYIEAGNWLAAHVERTDAIYYDDSRIAYYAGWGYPQQSVSRDQAMSPAHAAQYRYFLIEAEVDEPWLQGWLNQQHKRVLAQFANAKGDTVLAVGE